MENEVKQPVFRGLGKQIPEGLNYKQVMKYLELDYTVDIGGVHLKLGDEVARIHNKKSKRVTNVSATYRTDDLTIFGIVSDSYKIKQNIDIFKFVEHIVGEDKAIYDSGGILAGGAKAFIVLKLPYDIVLNQNDKVENFLTIITGHDGKTSIDMFILPMRLSCLNMLPMARTNSKFRFTTKHTEAMDDNLDEAMNILIQAKEIIQDMQLTFNAMINKKVTVLEAEEYFNKVFLSSEDYNKVKKSKVRFFESNILSTRKINILNDVIDYYNNGLGQEPIYGTVFGIYNAVTGYIANVKTFKSLEVRMESTMLGGRDQAIAIKALELAEEIINK